MLKNKVDMKTYQKGILIIILTLAFITVKTSFDERSFWNSPTFISQENFRILVNDEAIIIREFGTINLVDKESGNRMELGLPITIPIDQLNEEDHCKKSSQHIINKNDIIEYYICEDIAYFTKHNLKDFSVTKKTLNVMKYNQNSNANLYLSKDIANFGNSDTNFINRDIYSLRSNYLYKNNKKVIDEALFFGIFAVDDQEVFFININNDLKMVLRNQVISIVEKDAQYLLVTQQYIYYKSLNTNQIIQISKMDYAKRQAFPQNTSHKIRDFNDIVLMENSGRLSIYQDAINIIEIEDVEDFDVDDNYIYVINKENIIRKIDRNTFEVEAVFE